MSEETRMNGDEEVLKFAIRTIQNRCHETAITKGWWSQNRSIGVQIALMHSELSEALEEVRKNQNPSHRYTRESDGKPEGFVTELADVLIRIFDTCGYYNLPLADALIEKMEFNCGRPWRHGGKSL